MFRHLSVFLWMAMLLPTAGSCANDQSSTEAGDEGAPPARWFCAELVYADDSLDDAQPYDAQSHFESLSPRDEIQPVGFLTPLPPEEVSVTVSYVMQHGIFYRDDTELTYYLQQNVTRNTLANTDDIELASCCEGVLQVRSQPPVWWWVQKVEAPLVDYGVGGKGAHAVKIAGQDTTGAGLLIPELNWTGALVYTLPGSTFFRNEEEARRIHEVNGCPIYVWRQKLGIFGRPTEPDARYEFYVPFAADEYPFLDREDWRHREESSG